jgi:hypothetical protein
MSMSDKVTRLRIAGDSNDDGSYDAIEGYFLTTEEYERLSRLDKNIQQVINENKEFLTWESTKNNPRHRVIIENRIRELEVFYEY